MLEWSYTFNVLNSLVLIYGIQVYCNVRDLFVMLKITFTLYSERNEFRVVFPIYT